MARGPDPRRRARGEDAPVTPMHTFVGSLVITSGCIMLVVAMFLFVYAAMTERVWPVRPVLWAVALTLVAVPSLVTAARHWGSWP